VLVHIAQMIGNLAMPHSQTVSKNLLDMSV
jgi:hypothetical protein